MLHEIYTFLMQPFWAGINDVATYIVCSIAILVGSWRERFVGIAYMAAYLFLDTFALEAHRLTVFMSFTADILCLPAFLAADRKSPYRWTRWALVCQSLSVVTDIINLIIAKYCPPCLIAMGVLGYGVLGSLLIGILTSLARKRRERDGQISPASGDDGSA